eukprot:321268_1
MLNKRTHSKNENDNIDSNDPLNVDMNEKRWMSCCGYDISLTSAIITSVIIACILGTLLSATTNIPSKWYKLMVLIGDLWIRCLKLLVLPLIALLMVILPSRVDAFDIGYIAKQCIPLYITTSLCASIEGTTIALILQPGQYGSPFNIEQDDTDNDIDIASNINSIDMFIEMFYGAIPDNIIIALSQLSILGIIVFFLGLGILLRDIEFSEKIIVIKFCNAILKCVMKGLVYVIWFTPFGVTSLIIAHITFTDDIEGLLVSLAMYVLCMCIGVAVHLLILYPLLFYIIKITHDNKSFFEGWKFLQYTYDAVLLAFSTGSSSATLPKTLSCAKKAGINKQIYQLVIPLGSAINMDGTAIIFPISVLLIAQLNNKVLSLSTILTVVLLSVILSIGTAPIANSSMIYLIILLRAAGLHEYENEAIATIFIVQWLAGRIATMVNVVGDIFVSKITDDIITYSNDKNVNVNCLCCYSKRKQCQTVSV